MKKIKLTQRKVTFVDDDMFDYLSQWKWFAIKARNTFYAARNSYQGNKRSLLRMHRVILGLPINKLIDHFDGNGLNNQRSNLRVCTVQENAFNKKRTKLNKSGYKGVFWHKHHRKWHAAIKVNGRILSLGDFVNKQEAAKAYDVAVRKYYGDFGRLNFPSISSI